MSVHISIHMSVYTSIHLAQGTTEFKGAFLPLDDAAQRGKLMAVHARTHERMHARMHAQQVAQESKAPLPRSEAAEVITACLKTNFVKKNLFYPRMRSHARTHARKHSYVYQPTVDGTEPPHDGCTHAYTCGRPKCHTAHVKSACVLKRLR